MEWNEMILISNIIIDIKILILAPKFLPERSQPGTAESGALISQDFGSNNEIP